MLPKNREFEEKNNVIVKSLGIQEVDVYDIEVEDNHNFFANDILVHNSVYLNLHNILNQKFSDLKNANLNEVLDFINILNEKVIEPKIKEFFEKMCYNLNSFTNTLVMENEIVGKEAFFLAKKKYAIRILQKDGKKIDKDGINYVDKIELYYKGIEIVRTSTPQIVRDELKKCLKLIFANIDNKKNVLKFIDDFKSRFFKFGFDDVSNPRSVNGMNKYELGQKSVPIHVRGSLHYNNLIDKYNFQNKYRKIGEGDKIKFCYIKEPNEIKSNIIAFIDEFPKELKDKFKIDYKTQFEKTFIAPLDNFFETLKWDLNANADFDDLFQ